MNDTDQRSGPAGCQDKTRELLDFYLNGSLAPDEAEAVRRHLETCPACDKELDELTAIAAAFVARGLSRRAGVLGLRVPALVALAAALLVSGGLALWLATHPKRGAPVAAPESGEIVLELGAGETRSGLELPEVTLGEATTGLAISFFPPVSPGSLYRAGIVDAEGRVVVPPALLPPLDDLGRATLLVPAASLAGIGRYSVDLTVLAPGTPPETIRYPFEVRRSTRTR